MRKFQCFLSGLKQSYICYHLFCMTVPLNCQKSIHLWHPEDDVSNIFLSLLYGSKQYLHMIYAVESVFDLSLPFIGVTSAQSLPFKEQNKIYNIFYRLEESMLYYFIYGRFADDSACSKALIIISKNVHRNVIETKMQ